MIFSAINDKEPYLSQMAVLKNSMDRNSPGELCNFAVLPENTSREVMVCHRTCMFNCAAAGEDRLAWMDADCIVRGPLDGFWSGIEPDTLKILYRPEKKVNRRFQAAVFAFGVGKYVKKLIAKWNDVVQKSPEWYKDQEELYKCWQKYRDKVKLIPMKQKFNDSTFNDKSVIWHSKGHHFNDPKFQKEWAIYNER